MKTLGVLIETEDEPVSKKYYLKNKNSLQFLKEYGIYMDYIPYDYAIFAEIKNQVKKKVLMLSHYSEIILLLKNVINVTPYSVSLKVSTHS